MKNVLANYINCAGIYCQTAIPISYDFFSFFLSLLKIKITIIIMIIIITITVIITIIIIIMIIIQMIIGSFYYPFSLLAVSLYWLASIGGSSWKHGCTWHQLRTLLKYLGWRGWGDYWRFLKSSSLHRPSVLLWTRAQSDNICRKAAWLSRLKYLLTCRIALIGQLLELKYVR